MKIEIKEIGPSFFRHIRETIKLKKPKKKNNSFPLTRKINWNSKMANKIRHRQVEMSFWCEGKKIWLYIHRISMIKMAERRVKEQERFRFGDNQSFRKIIRREKIDNRSSPGRCSNFQQIFRGKKTQADRHRHKAVKFFKGENSKSLSKSRKREIVDDIRKGLKKIKKTRRNLKGNRESEFGVKWNF